ncbi:unnamed protein product, partial [Hapterophycus canaliculatus]
ADSGSTTARVVLVSVAFDIGSYVWKILTLLKVVTHSTSAFWDARIIFPLTEGLVVFPAAIVISVWMDVANNSLSRSKVIVLELALGAIGLGLTACGSGATKA